MTNHLEKQFAGYMTARYGKVWALCIPSDQLAETRQAFYMGALSYPGLVLNILNPDAGPTTPEDEVRVDVVFAVLADEIGTYCRGHWYDDLFAKATNGGGNA